VAEDGEKNYQDVCAGPEPRKKYRREKSNRINAPELRRSG
jgi:hypothetical protein